MPRATPHAVPWRPTPRWPTPEAFWSEPMDADEVGALAVKYSTLLGLIAMKAGLERDRGMRALAARWPGALREGQLAPIEALRARERALVEIGPVARATWWARGHGAVPLWSELHRLLEDLARLRAERPDPRRLPAGLGAETSGRWPTDPTWWAALPWPPGAQLPRSWLAAVCGASPGDLDRMLRGSSGP